MLLLAIFLVLFFTVVPLFFTTFFQGPSEAPWVRDWHWHRKERERELPRLARGPRRATRKPESLTFPE